MSKREETKRLRQATINAIERNDSISYWAAETWRTYDKAEGKFTILNSALNMNRREDTARFCVMGAAIYAKAKALKLDKKLRLLNAKEDNKQWWKAEKLLFPSLYYLNGGHRNMRDEAAHFNNDVTHSKEDVLEYVRILENQVRLDG